MFGPGKYSVKANKPRTVREERKKNLALNCNAEFGSMGLSDLECSYPSGLMFYDDPPRCQINLETMETLAIERLRFLRIIEKHSSSKQSEDDWRVNIKADLKSQGLDSYVNGYGKQNQTVLQNRCRDHFSHFILRLAYSRTEELRRWFIAQEVDAFRWRSLMASPEEIADFMAVHDLRFTPVPEEEKSLIRDLLDAVLNSAFREGNVTVESRGITYYKVHFTEALDLVRKRSVLIREGMCYVPETEMRTLLTWMFKSLLTQNLALTAKTLPNLDEDERLIKMLSDLDKRYTGGGDFSGQGEDSIKPEMIKPLSEKSFPICMRSMQATLDTSHHLKYKGRLQYGLFLKGIGLSLEDAIRFFRGEFTKSHVDPDKFDKEYTYGIRYNYGKEGKKVNWAPWNCMRIIMASVGPGENHGCPYKHHDHDKLRALLVKSGMEGEDLNQIVQAAREGHFQKACSLQFRAAHKGQEPSTGVINHPNQFYFESVHGCAPSSGSSKPQLKTERASVYPAKSTQP